MKVFLAGIIQGSKVEAEIHSQDWRTPLKDVLARRLPEADVYDHFERHPQSITYGMDDIRRTLADGNRRAAACDVLIAWLPSASMGTAVEMYEAARNSAVVLTVTPLMANWIVRVYSDRVFAGLGDLDAFLADGELAALLEAKGK